MFMAKPAVLASLLITSIAVGADATSEWRKLEPENTLYMELERGRIVIELAPQFAPNHVANIRQLVREQYFDGQRINRVQDNFVVQWGDPVVAKPLKEAKRALAAEFTRPAKGLTFTLLQDQDTYAPQTGFVDGFPAARDREDGSAWPVHCYGMVGVGRENSADSGSGAELYVVIGHAPRQLDRNITVVGRVVQGIDKLSSLPRGTGSMGFYQSPSEHTVIRSIRLAADVPDSERMNLEALRTDSVRFQQMVEGKRNRQDAWYKVPAGRIDVCNVNLPVRVSQ